MIRKIHYIKDMEQLKSFLNTRRMEILEVLAKEEATVKQLGDIFGKSPANIHHHVKNLEASGLITIVRTEEKSGILEKYYRAIAEKFVIDEAVGEPSECNASEKELCEIFLTSSKEDLLDGIEYIAGLPNEEVKQRIIRNGIEKGQISPQKLARFLGELNNLLDRYFKPADKGTVPDQIYTFNFQLYPAPFPVHPEKKSLISEGGSNDES